MSKFVSHADYWKDRAERAEAKLAELEGQEPVVKYSGKRLTPEGTKEVWGYLLSEVEPRENQELYARPVPSEPVNARLLDALKLAECVYRKNVVNEGEPSSVLEAMQSAITAAEAQRPTDYSSTVDRAWARFCGAFGDGPDAPYPGMIATFETHYGQSFRDKAWRTEAASREICYGKRAEALGTPEDQDRVASEQDFAPPARLTDEEITSLLAASDNNSPRVPSFFIAEPHRFARTIETAVLRKNGLLRED